MILRLFKWFHTLRHFGFLLSKFLPFYLLAGYFSSGHCDASVCVCVLLPAWAIKLSFITVHAAIRPANWYILLGKYWFLWYFHLAQNLHSLNASCVKHTHTEEEWERERESTSNGIENMFVHNLDSDNKSQRAIICRHRILVLITKCAPNRIDV